MVAYFPTHLLLRKIFTATKPAFDYKPSIRFVWREHGEDRPKICGKFRPFGCCLYGRCCLDSCAVYSIEKWPFDVWLGDSRTFVILAFDGPVLVRCIPFEVERHVHFEVRATWVNEADGRNALKTPVLGKLALDLASRHSDLDVLKIPQAALNPIRMVSLWSRSGCLSVRAELSFLGDNSLSCGIKLARSGRVSRRSITHQIQ
jgi:hypothetical protein